MAVKVKGFFDYLVDILYHEPSTVMKRSLLLPLCVLITLFSFGQNVGINEDGTDPNASAMLDVKSTTKGLLIPRLTTTQRTSISSPATGLLVFDSDTETFWFKETSAWVELLSGSTSSMEDADGDTKIQVEETADEDIIRFDIGGTEVWAMQGSRLESTNSGNSVFIGVNAGLNDDLSNNQNTFLGASSGTANQNGASNVAVGYGSFVANISGSNNTDVGRSALSTNSSGASNTAMGLYSLQNSTTANSNTAVGVSSLNRNVTGGNNTALGYQAGLRILGSGNISVGYRSDFYNETGSNNTIIGYEAGSGTSEHNKSSNILIGYQAGYNESPSNRLYIENSNSTTPLIYGEFDNDILRVNGTFQVDDPSGSGYSMPAADGASGQIMTTDGSGAITWGNVNVEDADGNTKIQVEETADEDIIRFDVGGSEIWTLDNVRLSVSHPTSSLFIGSNSGTLTGGTNIGIGENIMPNNTVGNVSVAIGNNALNANTVGGINIAIGRSALENNISGTANVAVAPFTLIANTTGHYNMAIGNYSMYASTTASYNVGLGIYTLNQNTGENNVSVGSNGIRNKVAGDGNTTLGHNVGIYMNAGSENTLVGYQAGGGGPGFHSKSGNVFIGVNAGFLENGSDKLYIENSNTTTPLIYGEFNNDILRINGTLQVDDPSGSGYGLPASDETSGQTMTTNGNGVITWGNVNVEDSDGDTKIQVEESADEDIIRFDVAGTERLTLKANANDVTNMEFVNNDQNVLIGDDAGLNLAPTGSYEGSANLFLGYYAGRTTTGYHNVFLGQRAGLGNTTGHHNVFVGKEAGSGNTDGIQNVFIGVETGKANLGGQYNSFYGAAARTKNTTGSSNTFIGRGAGLNNLVGNTNSFLGRESGNNATGSGNVFLGYHAGYSETADNKLYIENSNSSTPLIWGDFTSDLVGINRVATTNTLEVGGTASKASAGDWLANSDSRLKKNMTPLESDDMLRRLLSLQGIIYTWDDQVTGTQRPDGAQYGFTAQNIQKVFPSLVSEDQQGYLQTAYGTYDAMTIEAIRALHDMIVSLQSKIRVLEAQLNKESNQSVSTPSDE